MEPQLALTLISLLIGLVALVLAVWLLKEMGGDLGPVVLHAVSRISEMEERLDRAENLIDEQEREVPATASRLDARLRSVELSLRGVADIERARTECLEGLRRLGAFEGTGTESARPSGETVGRAVAESLLGKLEALSKHLKKIESTLRGGVRDLDERCTDVENAVARLNSSFQPGAPRRLNVMSMSRSKPAGGKGGPRGA